MVKAGPSERTTWVWFLHDNEIFGSPSAILHGTEPVSGLTCTLLYCRAPWIFSSQISLVTILLWQGLNSGPEARTQPNVQAWIVKIKEKTKASQETFPTLIPQNVTRAEALLPKQAGCSNCSLPGNFLCLCLPVWAPAVWPAKAVPERGPKSSPIDFAVKIFNCLLERDCQLTCRGLNMDSNLNSIAWPSCKGFICSEIPE